MTPAIASPKCRCSQLSYNREFTKCVVSCRGAFQEAQAATVLSAKAGQSLTGAAVTQLGTYRQLLQDQGQHQCMLIMLCCANGAAAPTPAQHDAGKHCNLQADPPHKALFWTRARSLQPWLCWSQRSANSRHLLLTNAPNLMAGPCCKVGVSASILSALAALQLHCHGPHHQE